MARKKRIVTTEEVENETDELIPESVEAEEPSREEVAEMDAIDYLLSLGGDDGVRYRVDKLPAKAGDREAFCNNYSRDSLTLDAIRDMFGGGTYKITAYAAGSRYAGQRRVTIADLPKSPTAPAGTMSQDLAAILQAAKGDNSSLALVMKMMESQSAMIAGLLSRPVPQAPPGPSFMEMLAFMKEMNRESPKSNEGSAVELLLKGIELGKEFTGGGEDSMMGLAGKGIEMLKPLIERGAQNPAPAASPAPAQLPAARLQTPQAPQPAEGDPMLRQLNWLRQQSVLLCHQASRGRDPALYAEVMLDNLPDFITEQDLLARLKEPNAIAQLAQVNADVLKFQPWFEEFRKAILAMFEGDADNAPQAGEEGVT